MLGYGVDDNAIRFSNYFHVVRELVHLSCGHLALEPRFEVKALLADHLHDDARAVTKISRRLYELRTPSEYPGAPSAELAALLDRAADAADTHEYLEIAYGELKPTLIAALGIHLAAPRPAARRAQPAAAHPAAAPPGAPHDRAAGRPPSSPRSRTPARCRSGSARCAR